MSDPEPCRMKDTEDPEEQRGWCLFFIHLFMMLKNIHVRNIQAYNNF